MIRALLITAALLLAGPAAWADGAKPSFKKVPGAEATKKPSASRFKKAPGAEDTAAPAAAATAGTGDGGRRQSAGEALNERFKRIDETKRKTPSETLEERANDLIKERTAAVEAAGFVQSAKACLAMIEDGTGFVSGDLVARDPNIDLSVEGSRQRWQDKSRSFQVRVSVTDGTSGDLLRSCTMRDGAGPSRDHRKRVQAEMIDLMKSLGGSLTYREATYPGKSDETIFLLSRNTNKRGKCHTVTMLTIGVGVDFMVNEISDARCEKLRA